MCAALGLSIFYLGALGLAHLSNAQRRLPGPIAAAAGVALRVILLLYPPAARDSLSLLNCSPASVSAMGAASLDGGPNAGVQAATSSRAVYTLSILAANPYCVCWARGGSHLPAGALAVASIFVVVVAVPLATLAALVWGEGGEERRLACRRLSSRFMRGAVESGGERSLTLNPLRLADSRKNQGAMQPPNRLFSADDTSGMTSSSDGPTLLPLLSDYRQVAWYTRHADMALALLIAALQVRAKSIVEWMSLSCPRPPRGIPYTAHRPSCRIPIHFELSSERPWRSGSAP